MFGPTILIPGLFFSHTVSGEMLSYALGIVSDYIKPDLSDKLAEHLGLEKVNVNKRKPTAAPEEKPTKRMKAEDIENISVKPPNTPKEKKASAKEIQMVKAASGTKSILSFFSKK